MGQYHLVVNLDKKQYIHAHRMGDGLKLREIAYSVGGVMTGLALLLAAQNGRGGGDVKIAFVSTGNQTVVGSWAGDKIAFVGDYAESGDTIGWDVQADMPTYSVASMNADGWVDISPQVRSIVAADGVFYFTTDEHGMVRRGGAYC